MATNSVTVSLQEIASNVPVSLVTLVCKEQVDGTAVLASSSGDLGKAPGEHILTKSAIEDQRKAPEALHMSPSVDGDQKQSPELSKGISQGTISRECNLTPSAAVDQEKIPEVRIPRKSPRTVRHSGHEETNGIEDKTANGVDATHSRDKSVGLLTDQTYTSDGGRVLRKKRRSTQPDVAQTCCTICGVTVRPSELQSHYDWEVDKLNKMLRLDGSRFRDPKPDRDRRKLSQPSQSSTTSSKRKLRDRASSTDANEDDPMEMLDHKERLTEFDKIKRRRQERLYSRLRKHRQSDFDNDEPSTSSTDGDCTTCPICHVVLTGSAEERNSHAEACLISGRLSPTQEDEDVDIEGENEGFDEYTWCGQTRVRVTSMLETGFKGLGYEVNRQNNDVDTELNIESDDDSAEFGAPQYSEADIIPCASEDMDEHTQTLRNAVLEGSQERVPPLHQGESSVIEDNCDANANVPNSAQTIVEASTSSDIKASFQGNPLYPGQSRTVVDCLKARIEDLEKMAKKQNSIRCLICMDSYRNATISVQCWHVHCEECWLRTLGAKKLCPQCNMITSPNQLRRIYL